LEWAVSPHKKKLQIWGRVSKDGINIQPPEEIERGMLAIGELRFQALPFFGIVFESQIRLLITG